MKEAKEYGVDAIKFHCYQQDIKNDVMNKYLEVAINASLLEMPIYIDCSYGSLKLYENDNLRLATIIASNVSNVPIILLHSGGSRILEAMLIAEAAQNVYLDMSFTITYYKDSSVEQDMAFAYKKIGYKRIIYGSDRPYVGEEDSKSETLKFLDKYNYKESEIDDIMFTNLQAVFKQN